MDAAVVGLIGTAIGAVAAVGGSVIGGSLQGRRERLTFLRERKADAYGRAIEHLCRAAARRSELTVQGPPILTKEDQREWFLDLASGLQALTTAVAYADEAWRDELRIVLQHYGMAVTDITQQGLSPHRAHRAQPYTGLALFADEAWSGDVPTILWQVVARVQEIAILDLSGYPSRQAALDARATSPVDWPPSTDDPRPSA